MYVIGRALSRQWKFRINALMAEVIEGHIRFHVVNLDRGSNAQQAGAVEELIDVIRAYLK